jgi:hypothetical protein
VRRRELELEEAMKKGRKLKHRSTHPRVAVGRPAKEIRVYITTKKTLGL